MIKKLIRSDGFRAFVCWLGAQYIRLIWLTGRWTIHNDQMARTLWAEDKPFILAFWHGHLLMMPYCWPRGKKMNMLISQHRDGQIIARIIRHFGLGTVAGSSSRGGSAALRTMLKALKDGDSIGITPDGPRGPRMRATPGIVNIARISGAPILPCAYSSKSRKQLGSWDRFQVALPFSSGHIVWGDPITIDKSADMEQEQQRLEQAMNDLAHQAEALCGHGPTPPADPNETPESRKEARRKAKQDKAQGQSANQESQS